MRITSRQIRQIIREELSRLQETRRDDRHRDDDKYYSGEEGGEEGTGYEYLRDMPGTLKMTDGPVDEEWVSQTMRRYAGLPRELRLEIAKDFVKMLTGRHADPDIVERYRRSDGTSRHTRQTFEALVDMLHSGG